MFNRSAAHEIPDSPAYPRETQEMVFDAHARAFAFFKGTCTRGIYDNMKTAVETVFVGRDRQYNRRFLRMCGPYLVEPVACTPHSFLHISGKFKARNSVHIPLSQFGHSLQRSEAR
jgi:transposase